MLVFTWLLRDVQVVGFGLQFSCDEMLRQSTEVGEKEDSVLVSGRGELTSVGGC